MGKHHKRKKRPRDRSMRKISHPPIPVRNLPGVAALERALLWGLTRRGPTSAEVDHEVNIVSEQLFGITRQDTEYSWPDGDPPVRAIEDPWRISDVERRHLEYEQRFKTTDLSDEEAVVVLRGLGLDFTDEQGRPLRCTTFLSRQAEAAAKGIAGKLPDPVAANVHLWETGLTEARDAFMANKRRRGAGTG